MAEFFLEVLVCWKKTARAPCPGGPVPTRSVLDCGSPLPLLGWSKRTAISFERV